MSITAKLFEELILVATLPMHRLSRNKTFLRQTILQEKSFPLLTASLAASLNRNMSRALSFAREVEYPYLVLLGEKDTIVDNRSAREWHGKTAS
jgi:alpha-beta hydrolase superfamily lysophospholipase